MPKEFVYGFQKGTVISVYILCISFIESINQIDSHMLSHLTLLAIPINLSMVKYNPINLPEIRLLFAMLVVANCLAKCIL